MKHPVARRIETNDRKDWERAYRSLLPPLPTPRRTPDCTCDWVEVKELCEPEPWVSLTQYGDDCPDHTKPERTP